MDKGFILGIVGLGSMGTNHLRVALRNSEVNSVMVFDPDEAPMAVAKASDRRVMGASSVEDMQQVDGIVIASPTHTHFKLAGHFIELETPILIEKPATATTEECRSLIESAGPANSIIAVGNVERFNPAIVQLQGILESHRVLSVDVSRLSYNTTRATDVDVIFDLMIHDIDLMQYLFGDIKFHSAMGQAKKCSNLDNVTALFSCGDIDIKLYASKVYHRRERIMKLNCEDCTIVLDLAEKTIHLERLHSANYLPDTGGLSYAQESSVTKIQVANNEPLLAEQINFCRAARSKEAPRTSLIDGMQNLVICEQIRGLLT